MRIRIYYEKRGGACFVPHVALAQVFIRSAFRAGLNSGGSPLRGFEMTQGFSPRPKMSFGPELPAGVVALREPLDIYLNLDNFNDLNLDDWNVAMPEGFKILSKEAVDEGEPALGKICREALYWIRGADANKNLNEKLIDNLKLFYGDDILDLKIEVDASDDNFNNKWIAVLLNAPAKNGIGGWVKNLIAEGVINGWQDINIVRIAIGILR